MKVGLIGCGALAQRVHLNLLRRLPGVSLVALAEPDAERRAAAARLAPAARPFASAAELLDSGLVEAVVICSPPAHHAEAAIAAFERGLHVYLEKPIALSLADGRRLVASARAAGCVGMLGYNYRFHALYQALAARVRRGELGEALGAYTVFSHPARALPAWKRQRATGGGALLELGSHHIDLLRFIFQTEVTAVAAELRSMQTEGDNAWLLLRLANGVTAQAYFSLTAGDAGEVEVWGTRRRLRVDRYRSFSVQAVEPVGLAGRVRGYARTLAGAFSSPQLRHKLIAPAREPSYAAALAQFAAAAAGRAPAAPDLEDGLRGLAVIEAAERAAVTGQFEIVSALPWEADRE
jgi:predicted dehydrogenase